MEEECPFNLPHLPSRLKLFGTLKLPYANITTVQGKNIPCLSHSVARGTRDVPLELIVLEMRNYFIKRATLSAGCPHLVFCPHETCHHFMFLSLRNLSLPSLDTECLFINSCPLLTCLGHSFSTDDD